MPYKKTTGGFKFDIPYGQIMLTYYFIDLLENSLTTKFTVIKMRKLLTLVALTAALAATGACSKKKDESMDNTMPPAQGAADVNSEALPGVNTSAQEQLVATAGDRVFFDFNGATLSSEAQATLTKQAQWLSGNATNVTVEGHCDERGTREYNLALGEKRATAVKNFLVSKGVPATRITTISYGKEFPEFLGSNEEAWSKNRRAVTVVNQ